MNNNDRIIAAQRNYQAALDALWQAQREYSNACQDVDNHYTPEGHASLPGLAHQLELARIDAKRAEDAVRAEGTYHYG